MSIKQRFVPWLVPAVFMSLIVVASCLVGLSYDHSPSTPLQISNGISKGSNLPLFCTIGDLFFTTSAPAGLNACISSNTWALMAGSNSSPTFNTINAATYQLNGAPVAQPVTCTDTAGQHLNYTGSAYACGTSTPTGMVTQTGSITAGHVATWNSTDVIQDGGALALPNLSGTTGSIGGGLLAAGACASGTATVSGATVSMVADAQASDGTNIPGLGTSVSATVTSANTVTVSVCALLAVTPTAKTYNVRVFQ